VRGGFCSDWKKKTRVETVKSAKLLQRYKGKHTTTGEEQRSFGVLRTSKEKKKKLEKKENSNEG